MISIVCKSIKAQRIGNWLLHLEAVTDMLPYFAASGHYLYLKLASLYLQSLHELETTNPTVFDYFKDNGFHVIRTSGRYWGGISTDLTVEQKLVRSVKTTGGLTRGKGMGEVQRTIWLFSTPICAEIKDALRNITGVSYETSEQQKETTLSRGKRDYKDASIIAEHIVYRNPFQKSIDLIGIETGEVADCLVNAYLANEIGEKIIQDMEGIPVLDYSFKTKDNAKIRNTSSNIKLDNEAI